MLTRGLALTLSLTVETAERMVFEIGVRVCSPMSVEDQCRLGMQSRAREEGPDMTQSLLARSAAPLAIVAGVLVVINRAVMLTVPTDVDSLMVYVLTPIWSINSIAQIVAFAMLVIALVATYELQARETGVFGVVAVCAAIFGTVFMAGDWWYEAFAVPRIAEVDPSVMVGFAQSRLLLGGLMSFALFGIGWGLYGIASVRARVFPAAISWAFAVGGLLSAVPIGVVYLSGNVILGLALVALGIWLIRIRTRTARNSHEASASAVG